MTNIITNETFGTLIMGSVFRGYKNLRMVHNSIKSVLEDTPYALTSTPRKMSEILPDIFEMNALDMWDVINGNTLIAALMRSSINFHNFSLSDTKIVISERPEKDFIIIDELTMSNVELLEERRATIAKCVRVINKLPVESIDRCYRSWCGEEITFEPADIMTSQLARKEFRDNIFKDAGWELKDGEIYLCNIQIPDTSNTYGMINNEVEDFYELCKETCNCPICGGNGDIRSRLKSLLGSAMGLTNK